MSKLSRFKDPTDKLPYVTNAELLPLIIRDKAAGVLSDELAGLLMRIAEKYSRSRSWKDYSFREDMVAEAVYSLSRTWHKFNETKYVDGDGRAPNPFSFYTTSCYYSFLKVLNKEKEARAIRDELLLDAGQSPSFGFQGSSDDFNWGSQSRMEFDR